MRLIVGIPEPHVTREVLEPAAEAVTRLDEQLIQQGDVPTFHEALARGKVRWRPEDPGDEKFDHASTVLQRGWGDCDDLAPWRAASARATGEDPGARAVMLRKSPTLWHCVVQMSDGSIQDPSKEAGMGRRNGQGEHAPATPIIAPAVSVSGVKRPHLAVRPVYRNGRVSGWQGRVDLPMTATEAALVQLHYAPVASQAIVGACNAIGTVADAACTMFDPDTIGPVDAIAGLLSGYPAREVARICGDEAVERAIDWLDHAETICGPLHNRQRSVFVGGIFDDIVDAASSAVDAVGDVVDDVGSAIDSATHALEPVWDAASEVLSAAQGVISLIPGIGTGISAAISAGLALLKGGSAINIALNAAYGAIPIPPGIRNLTDMAMAAALKFIDTGDIGDAAIAAARSEIPAGLPQDIFDTLMHLVVGFIGGKPTMAIATPKPGVAAGTPAVLMNVPVLHITTAQAQKIMQPVFHPLQAATLAKAAVDITKRAAVLDAFKGFTATKAAKTIVPPPPPPQTPPVPPPPQPPLTDAQRGALVVRPAFMAALPSNVVFVAPAGVAV